MHWEELWKCHNALKRDFALKKKQARFSLLFKAVQ